MWFFGDGGGALQALVFASQLLVEFLDEQVVLKSKKIVTGMSFTVTATYHSEDNVLELELGTLAAVTGTEVHG